VERDDDMMLQQIEELLNADEPTLDTLESTLTDGYAQALALEAERWRLERRLSEVAREGGTSLGDELSSIGQRLNVADDELSKLRSLLGTLHERARSARRS
jgi:hypothetical protein